MDLVLISGLSGSGKSVALHVLEDAGYYCVDNLPVVMLTVLLLLLEGDGIRKVAVGIDARSGDGIEQLPEKMEELSLQCKRIVFLFLQASDETLLKRYSESRRRHPMALSGHTLEEAIRAERQRLDPIVDLGHRIDTSDLKTHALREWVRQFIHADPGEGLILLFESFGFKHGIPLDADLVFDARCLPNPFYEPALRPLTGLDRPVAAYLENQPEVLSMREDIRRFVATWLPAYIRDNRNYLTVAIGCTGGQHRSVYLAHWLGQVFKEKLRVLIRHRAPGIKKADGPGSA